MGLYDGSATMRLLRRILITTAIALGMIAFGVYWVAPVVLSFQAARKAPPVARVVPADLRDLSVSQTSGTKLSYVGYEFEIPWNDLDESQTRQSPKDNPNMVALKFRSGRSLLVTTSPPRALLDNFARQYKLSPTDLESLVGRHASESDYDFLRALYGFTPDKMHYWTVSPALHYREQFLLLLKSIVLFKSAENGIFSIQSGPYRGFQQGDPNRPGRILVQLFSDSGNIEFFLGGKDMQSPTGLTQPEVNRIVQSFHRIQQGQSAAPPVAQR